MYALRTMLVTPIMNHSLSTSMAFFASACCRSPRSCRSLSWAKAATNFDCRNTAKPTANAGARASTSLRTSKAVGSIVHAAGRSEAKYTRLLSRRLITQQRTDQKLAISCCCTDPFTSCPLHCHGRRSTSLQAHATPTYKRTLDEKMQLSQRPLCSSIRCRQPQKGSSHLGGWAQKPPKAMVGALEAHLPRLPPLPLETSPAAHPKRDSPTPLTGRLGNGSSPNLGPFPGPQYSTAPIERTLKRTPLTDSTLMVPL